MLELAWKRYISHPGLATSPTGLELSMGSFYGNAEGGYQSLG